MLAWLRLFALLAVAVALGLLFRSYRWLGTVLALGGGLAFSIWWYRVRPQHRSPTLEARRLGFDYARGDRLGVAGYPLALLRRGAERTVEHVMWGTWRDLQVTVFDLWIAPVAGGAAGRTRLTCALGPAPGDFPALRIESVGLLPDVAEPATGVLDEALAERYLVSTQDEAFARSLLDARMAAYLRELSEPWGFELAGRTLCCYGPWREPWDLHALLSAFRAFVDRIPDEVRTAHAAAPAAEPGAAPDPAPGSAPGSTPGGEPD